MPPYSATAASPETGSALPRKKRSSGVGTGENVFVSCLIIANSQRMLPPVRKREWAAGPAGGKTRPRYRGGAALRGLVDPQNTGAGANGSPESLLEYARNGVLCPNGTYRPSSMATRCSSAAIRFCSAGSELSAYWSRSASTWGKSGQPYQALSPSAAAMGVRTGSARSAVYILVFRMLQPPSAGSALDARREATLCQSMAASVTLKPALRSAWAMTTGCGDSEATSVACSISTGVLS